MTYSQMKIGDLVESMGYLGIITSKFKINDKRMINLYWFICCNQVKDPLVRIPQFVTVWDTNSLGKLKLLSR